MRMKKFLRISVWFFSGIFLFAIASPVYSNTYIHGNIKSVFGIKTSLAGSCPILYVTTGSEAQIKTGALSIVGLFKAFSGVNLNAQRVINVGAPVAGTDVATKAYVDQVIANAKGCVCP